MLEYLYTKPRIFWRLKYLYTEDASQFPSWKEDWMGSRRWEIISTWFTFSFHALFSFSYQRKKTRPIKVHYLSKFDCFPFMTKLNLLLFFFIQNSPFPFLKFTFARDALLRNCLRHLSFFLFLWKLDLYFFQTSSPPPRSLGPHSRVFLKGDS